MSKFFYLASPYSNPDAGVRHQKAVAVMTVYAKLLDEGRLGFCPIAHSHEVSLLMRNAELRDSYELWMAIDLPMLRVCDVVYVLTVEGWNTSRGIATEVAEAHLLGIPIRFITEDGILTDIPTTGETAPWSCPRG